MDTQTQKLIQNIEGYLDNPPPGVPETLIDNIENTREMLTAPRYENESPGEKEAREVAEESMPEDAFKDRYENND